MEGGASRDVAALYRAHIADATRLGFLLTGDLQSGQDLAHDAFLRAAAQLRTIRHPDRFGAYLRRAVVRAALMERRSAARRRVRQERAAPPALATDETSGIAGRVDLLAALWQLPPRQRAALVLRYWHDLPEREMAAALGCRPGTVKSLLSRGLATLRQEVSIDV